MYRALHTKCSADTCTCPESIVAMSDPKPWRNSQQNTRHHITRQAFVRTRTFFSPQMWQHLHTFIHRGTPMSCVRQRASARASERASERERVSSALQISRFNERRCKRLQAHLCVYVHQSAAGTNTRVCYIGQIHSTHTTNAWHCTLHQSSAMEQCPSMMSSAFAAARATTVLPVTRALPRTRP
jgi:hypothetical protein